MKAYYTLTGVSRPRLRLLREVEYAMKRYDADESGYLDFKVQRVSRP